MTEKSFIKKMKDFSIYEIKTMHTNRILIFKDSNCGSVSESANNSILLSIFIRASESL